ncbi:MAG TPA: hypothetical protein VMU61_05415 [Candidatus Aquilonibacter sp.]|nr:hypothetical protein [Candidatus Aquilonibacter sp.]
MAQDEKLSKESKAKDELMRAGIQKSLDLAARCSTSENSDNYEFLEEQIDQLEAQARSAFQSRMDVASLLPKLAAKKLLTPDDLKTLEMLIVGDAEYYLKYEPELDEWKAELRRVLDQIKGLQNSTIDVEGLMHIRALCREAHQVVADLVFYFDAKERAAKFQAVMNGPLSSDDYSFLTDMVAEMLAEGNK